MVRMTFSGGWSSLDETAALECIRKVLNETLGLDVSPAFFEIRLRPEAEMREISLVVELFPAGNGRTRRMAVQTLTRELEKIADRARVEIVSPPQEKERRSS